MSLKIGFPRTLFYFMYYPFWHVFFTEMGFEVVRSYPTSKYSLDLGAQETVNDACMPIKIYHGHVAELKDKVDVLFMPRMVSVRRLEDETFCPKFLGLPDMVKSAINDLPRIIDNNVDLGKGLMPLRKLCNNIAHELGQQGWSVWQAYNKANKVQEQFNLFLSWGIPAEEAIEAAINGRSPQKETVHSTDLNLAILGYPYLIYDSFINIDLFAKLNKIGVKTWTVEMVPPQRLDYQAKYLPKNLFWHFSNRTVRATYYYLKEKRVDGIIHVTAFGCGPDAMVDKLMELEAKYHDKTPFLTLTLDEHTGEAGVATRVEAFTDMLRLRRNRHENSVSHHG